MMALYTDRLGHCFLFLNYVYHMNSPHTPSELFFSDIVYVYFPPLHEISRGNNFPVEKKVSEPILYVISPDLVLADSLVILTL
jgi:hypothetical protein